MICFENEMRRTLLPEMPPDVGTVKEGDRGMAGAEMGAKGLGIVGEGATVHETLAKHVSPEGHSLFKP
jgi:hypothetical protein